jgi:hypothetical protein
MGLLGYLENQPMNTTEPFVCGDPEGCHSKRERWPLSRAQRVLWDREFSSWQGRILTEEKHLALRRGQRGVSMADVRAILQSGCVIHMSRGYVAGSRRVVVSSCTATGRPLHVVADYRPEGSDIVLITVYDPAARPWQWDTTYCARLHWCRTNPDED